MKTKISISIDEDTLKQLEDVLRQEEIFRNKSHIIEYSVKKFLNGDRK